MNKNIILAVYEFSSKVERQFECFYKSCYVFTRISYLKGIEKISENRCVFQNAL